MYQVECRCGAVFDANDDDVPVWRCPACQEIVEPCTGDDDGTEEDLVDEDAASEVEGAWEDEPTILTELPAVFLYPLRGDGPYILVGGWLLGVLPVTLMAGYVLIGSISSFYVLPGFVLVLLLTGYFYHYLCRVIEEASAGRPQSVDWPAIEGMWSLIVGAGSAGGVVLAAFLPLGGLLVTVAIFADPFVVDPRPFGIALLLSLLASGFLLPITLLAASLRGLPWAFAYWSHFRAIHVAPSSYGFCALVSAGVLGLLVASLFLLRVHFLLGLVVPAPAVYLLTVLARAIGVYYYTCRRRLGWFRV